MVCKISPFGRNDKAGVFQSSLYIKGALPLCNPEGTVHFVYKSPNSAIIHDAMTGWWLHFREPQRVIEVSRVEDVVPGLGLVESIVRQHGLYAAGFISYEAAPAFDAALRTQPPSSFPLLWFGFYSAPDMVRLSMSINDPAFASLPWVPSISREAYDRAISDIKTFIAYGETYQVNFTFRLRALFSGDHWEFFLNLAEAQQADYAAYVDTGRFVICSASPELFFQLNGRQLLSRPMKGTAARGLTSMEDAAAAERLRLSEKNRAENVMIVDMVRNDMGRIADVGSVRVEELFKIEKYPTLWQMTSTVTATTGASLCNIMAALFPCASITGAPKPRTMKIIAELETTPRNIYTGCIGFIAPSGKAQFNVAIRTVLIDRASGEAEYGIGGGILWDSTSGEEYSECLVKARVLTKRRPEFSLLETILWTPKGGFYLLDDHLRRLHNSALYFGFPVNLEAVREKLAVLTSSHGSGSYRVRLLLAEDGTVSCQSSLLDGSDDRKPVRLKLAPMAVDSSNPFLYHKTTYRRMYDDAQIACPDCDDVVLWNERGEVTETCIANIVVFLEGKLVTPPVSSGLLPGIFRARLISDGRVTERILKVDDLKRSKRIFTVNSVRRWRRAVLVPSLLQSYDFHD
jgi:para-aminobenzoate synthetase/4-amino-4-deoxychorismate lyase